MKIYQVGGAVRDKIMGIEPHDFDYMVVGSDIQEMKALGFKQVGKQFPVFLHPKTKDEYALARKEIKIGPKHADFSFIFDRDVTLEEDLLRRDFTCNALAYDIENDKVVDFHNGIQDIQNKILRHITAEHFIEDPLRILRMCRFAAQLNFEVAPETLELTKKMTADGMLLHLSAERIWGEFHKALMTEHFEKFIFYANACGALQYILPELLQNNKISDFDSLRFEKIKDFSPKVKFAVLISRISSLDHSALSNIAQRLKLPNEFRNLCSLFYNEKNNFYNLTRMNFSDLVCFYDRIHKFFETFLSACEADALLKQSGRDDNFFFCQSKLSDIHQILKDVKATDMPDFQNIPKDENFQRVFLEYRTQLLQKKL